MSIIQRKCRHHGLTDFYVFKAKSGYHHPKCKLCSYENLRRVRASRKLQLVQEFGGKCQICSYSKYQGALHFHHLDPLSKFFQIARGSSGITGLRKEAKKCVLLCANCHSEVEAGITTLRDIV